MDDEQWPRKLQKIHDGSAITPEGAQNSSSDRAVYTDRQANERPSARQDEECAGKNENNYEPAEVPAEANASGSGLSKNQLKKLRRREQWEAGREWRKERRKEKARAKKERERAARAEQLHEVTEPEGDGLKLSRRTAAKSTRGRSTLLPITFLLDCDFDDLMTEKERISLGSQVTRCYAENSRAPYRGHLVIASFNKKLKERFDTVILKQYEQWKGVTVTQDDYLTAAGAAQSRMREEGGGEFVGVFANRAESTSAEHGEVIYLTSDSPDTLTELKPYNTYVIGALVDKNRHKGVCYKNAMSRGVKTARLPIGDYMQMTSRFVLTTNHVLDIMLKWLEYGDWAHAFDLVMPKRKGGKLKSREEEAQAEEPGDADGEDANGDGEEEASSTVVNPGAPQVQDA